MKNFLKSDYHRKFNYVDVVIQPYTHIWAEMRILCYIGGISQ